MLKVYTDASWKDGVSSHHYYVKKSGKKIKKRTFLSQANQTPTQAEAMTIIEALKFYYKKGVNNLVIFTDCKRIVEQVYYVPEENEEVVENSDVQYIKHMLKVMNSELKWIPRETRSITKADTECRKMMKTKFRRAV